MNEAVPVIWEGVHASFDDIEDDSRNSFSTDRWLRAMENRLQQSRQSLSAGNVKPCRLSAAAEIVMDASDNDGLWILDFGGGLGADYFDLAGAVGRENIRRYLVVEFEAVCRHGDAILADEDILEFAAALPAETERFDVIYLGSSIQYMRDWKGLLTRMAAFGPQMIVLDEVPSGPLPHSFVTAQNYYGRKIPAWMFREDEMVSLMRECGYHLVWNESHKGRYLGIEGPPPTGNLPEKYRLNSFRDIAFARNPAVPESESQSAVFME